MQRRFGIVSLSAKAPMLGMDASALLSFFESKPNLQTQRLKTPTPTTVTLL